MGQLVQRSGGAAHPVPDALLTVVRLPFVQSTVPKPTVELHVDIVLNSFEDALAFVAQECTARN